MTRYVVQMQFADNNRLSLLFDSEAAASTYISQLQDLPWVLERQDGLDIWVQSSQVTWVTVRPQEVQ